MLEQNFKDLKVWEEKDLDVLKVDLVLSNGYSVKKLQRLLLVWDYALMDFRTNRSRLRISHAEVGGASDGVWTLSGLAWDVDFSKLKIDTFPHTSVRLHVDTTSLFDRKSVTLVNSKQKRGEFGEPLPSGVYSVEGLFPAKEKDPRFLVRSVFEPGSVLVVRPLTVAERLGVWDVNGKVIKGCAANQN